ncbi:DUF2975 domain-containing protein [Tellurirhabdus rosea]|uniref:DUF2975 domain-containing protein n=1 Tax=Tellurirhabdus rosea TaxID=2674997 RepID=UPI0022588159|nr:DUF2975 domain-containing protein [Tellurirhabdus rosea]
MKPLASGMSKLFAFLFYGQGALVLVYLLAFGSILATRDEGRDKDGLGMGVYIALHGVIQPINSYWVRPPVFSKEISRQPPLYVQSPNDFGTLKLNFTFRSWKEFRQFPLHLLLLTYSGMLLLVLLGLAITWRLKALFEGFSRDDIFSPWQISHLNRVGWLLLSYYVLVLILHHLRHYFTVRYLEQLNFRFEPQYDGSFFFPADWSFAVAGVFLIILSHVFQYGLSLREEHDLTI